MSQASPNLSLEVDVDALVAALCDVVPSAPALHEPTIEGNAWEYVKSCLESGWVSTAGSFVTRFEIDLASLFGVRHVIATNSGSAALHVALLAAGVVPGDEVLVPALTFAATANAVSYCGATPHFVDSAESTLGVDPVAIAAYLDDIAVASGDVWINRVTKRPLRAIVPVHIFGHPVDMDPLVDLAARYGLAVVEDAAESIGSTYKGRACGTLGDVAAISFNGNKIVTTGGGGAILTDNDELADVARHLTTTAKLPHRWAYQHDQVGFNYRLPNINAALGVAQLEILDELLRLKRQLTAAYARALDAIPGVHLFIEPAGSHANYWLNALVLDRPDIALRDRILAATNDAGLATRPAWEPLNRSPMYAECPRMALTACDNLAAGIINLPSSPSLAR